MSAPFDLSFFNTYLMKKSIRIFWIVFLSGVGLFVLLILFVWFGAFGKLPGLKELENPSIVQSSEVFASDGTLMGKYYSEKGNRSVVNYRDISKNVINALVATEDERFYNHSGIDFKRTAGAIVRLGSNGGGSTISQQLALNLFNGERASNVILRGIQKLKEYIIAIKLERNFTKEEIIALYLNAVPFGDNVYGIRNASRTFFSKEPDRLSVEEAAVLVGMLKGNSMYNPRLHPKRAKDRRNVVLSQMERNNYLATAEATRLKALPITLNYRKLDENTGYAPYFREILRSEVNDILKDVKNPDGDNYNVYNDGLKIYTTINPKMQTYAEEAMAQQMPMLQKAMNAQSNIKKGTVWKGHEDVLKAAMHNSDRWRNLKDEDMSDADIEKTFRQKTKMRVFAWNAKREIDTVMTPMDSIKYHRQMMQSAFMVMDPVTGEVRAWVGGISFKTYKLDHANLKTKRQVGSSIKPLLYCQAIEERGFTPETLVEDVQQSFGKGQLVPATGKTCTGRTVTMASALTWSRNCATAYIMKQVGAREFTNFLENKLNIPTKVDAFPSIALGACDLSLYEMMWAYTVFPGGGFSTKPVFISRIEDRNGNVIYRTDAGSNRKEAVSEATAYRMTQMMQGPVTVGTAAGLMDRLGAKAMGGKTGTTNNNADFWFMGYTPQLLAGTWVGCDDRFIQIESASFYGGTAARPIWEAFFKKVYADKALGISREADFLKPADLDNEVLTNEDYGVEDISVDTMGGFNSGDYGFDSTNNIPAESKLPENDDAPAKQDQKPKKDSSKTPKIGDMKEEKKEKRNIFQKIFKKDKENDY